MDIFVVYAYCREDGTYYYIGKGKPSRPYRKRGYKGINPPKDRSRILILHSDLSEETAFEYEKKLILFYGRKDLNSGLLRNRTDGGEGSSGWKHTQEFKERKSTLTKESHKKNRDSDGKSKLAKRAAAALNLRLHSTKDEYGGSVSAKKSHFAKKARPITVTNIESGEEFFFPSSVDAGLALGLSPDSLRLVASGKRKSHKGYLALYAGDAEEEREAKVKAKERTGREIRKKTAEDTSKQRWRDPDHPELGESRASTLVRMQKRRGYPHGKENRVRIS